MGRSLLARILGEMEISLRFGKGAARQASEGELRRQRQGRGVRRPRFYGTIVRLRQGVRERDEGET